MDKLISIKMLAHKSIFNFVQKYPITAYCLLTFSITWGLKYWYSLVRTEDYLPPFNFSLIAQYGPSISAVLLVALGEGRQGLRRISQNMLNWRLNPWWMLLAFVFEPVIFLSFTVFYGYKYHDISLAGWFTLASGIASYGLTFLTGLIRWGLSEEIGWRGWMLPKLQSTMSPFMATIILSIVISLWHIHPNSLSEIALSKDGTSISGYFPEIIERLIISFPITLVTTYIFNKTNGNLLVMMIFHSASNTSYFWIEDVFAITRTDFFKTAFLVEVLVIGIVFSILVVKQKEKYTYARS